VDVRRPAGFAFDAVAVSLFVGIGRDVHAHGLTFRGFASTAWPFATGLVIGWIVLAVWRRPPRSLRGGLTVCLATVSVGMTLRVVSGQGTAFAFVLVALGFLGSAMLGWRLVDIASSRARSSRAVRGAG
jgi:hypothetical protein